MGRVREYVKDVVSGGSDRTDRRYYYGEVLGSDSSSPLSRRRGWGVKAGLLGMFAGVGFGASQLGKVVNPHIMKLNDITAEVSTIHSENRGLVDKLAAQTRLEAAGKPVSAKEKAKVVDKLTGNEWRMKQLEMSALGHHNFLEKNMDENHPIAKLSALMLLAGFGSAFGTMAGIRALEKARERKQPHE